MFAPFCNGVPWEVVRGVTAAFFFNTNKSTSGVEGKRRWDLAVVALRRSGWPVCGFKELKKNIENIFFLLECYVWYLSQKSQEGHVTRLFTF